MRLHCTAVAITSHENNCLISPIRDAQSGEVMRPGRRRSPCGLGEAMSRRPSPFFWHPRDLHPYGELQILARQNSRKCPGSAEAFMAAYNIRNSSR